MAATYPIEIAGLHRDLALAAIDDDLTIAVLNILGDTELVERAAGALAERLATIEYAVLLTAEAKSIPLAHALSVATGRPYAVLRKHYRSYMGEALSATSRSITTGASQTLYLDGKDRALVEHARLVLVDDVISTGSTLEAMTAIATEAASTVAARAAILTEGQANAARDQAAIIALGHLPLFDGHGRPRDPS